VDDDTVIYFNDPDDPINSDDPAEVDGAYAAGRFTTRTYASRSFTKSGFNRVPARFVTKVFDTEDDMEPTGDEDEMDVYQSPKGRAQVKLLVSREAGHVSHLWVQKIKTVGGRPRADNVVSLGSADAMRLVELIKTLDVVPVKGDETIRVDDSLLKELFASPESLIDLYNRDRELFRRLITSDAAEVVVHEVEARTGPTTAQPCLPRPSPARGGTRRSRR